MVIFRCFHLHTLTPLLGSQPSFTRTLNVYLTGRQKWRHPGQTAFENVEGTSCGRNLDNFDFHGHVEDPCIAELEDTSRRFRGFICSTKALSTIMKFLVIRCRAFCGCICFLHRCWIGDATIVATKEASQMETYRKKRHVRMILYKGLSI